ncbi:transposase [Granulicella mallensis]|uniref:Transposase IS200-family protein n=1 Tax=Granulicella mallensis (strain ATCC BAA-1857 / DSM 23137 / MP5ACTX8) TaxID=682795 RepID=G8NQF6_GRAMM|nr:transposase [Granulicella mallensis]AEU36105.1 transposase IS200-family protein [Granulicella mallensis MP5ACTX8]
MPKDLVRYQQTGNLHLVTFSCYRRLPYLGTPAIRELFERSLEKMRMKYDFYINAYVVMPEHVHLLINEPKRAILVKTLQALKISAQAGAYIRNPFGCRHEWGAGVHMIATFAALMFMFVGAVRTSRAHLTA